LFHNPGNHTRTNALPPGATPHQQRGIAVESIRNIKLVHGPAAALASDRTAC
jgi:hypothetical protein